jgi:hypothetical protein
MIRVRLIKISRRSGQRSILRDKRRYVGRVQKNKRTCVVDVPKATKVIKTENYSSLLGWRCTYGIFDEGCAKKKKKKKGNGKATRITSWLNVELIHLGQPEVS